MRRPWGGSPFRILNPMCLRANIEQRDMMAFGGAVERGIQSIEWAFGKTWNELKA